MANLHAKLRQLQEHFYCPEHPDEPLLRSERDLLELPAHEWSE